MNEQLYNGKPLEKLSDGEVLELAGSFGPGIIGQELYERAQAIQKSNPGGIFGPAILDPNYGKDVKAAVAAADPTWDDLTRADVAALATEHGVSFKAKASRTSLIEALVEAGITPPPANPETTE